MNKMRRFGLNDAVDSVKETKKLQDLWQKKSKRKKFTTKMNSD